MREQKGSVRMYVVFVCVSEGQLDPAGYLGAGRLDPFRWGSSSIAASTPGQPALTQRPCHLKGQSGCN